MTPGDFIQIDSNFFIHRDFVETLRTMGLASLKDVFAYNQGRSLHKSGLANWRQRTELLLPDGKKVFLKRYSRPPISLQIKNWLSHRHRTLTAYYDFLPCEQLNTAGICTPQTIAFGGDWRGLWENRSFVMMLEIPDGQSLEQKLPDCFYQTAGKTARQEKLHWINRLAQTAKAFHETGFRHQDFYLCHWFLSGQRELYLIDLQRCFKPVLFKSHYRLKDLTQLYYSSPGDIISQTDRLRFYLDYTGRKDLSTADRLFLKRLKRKAWRIADREIRRGKPVPFAK